MQAYLIQVTNIDQIDDTTVYGTPLCNPDPGLAALYTECDITLLDDISKSLFVSMIADVRSQPIL